MRLRFDPGKNRYLIPAIPVDSTVTVEERIEPAVAIKWNLDARVPYQALHQVALISLHGGWGQELGLEQRCQECVGQSVHEKRRNAPDASAINRG
jgi:hypothetical protein